MISRDFVEDVWKRPSVGYFLVAVAVAVCIRWYFHIPPPTYSVTFMAVAAGLMALRPEMKGREKWLWTMVLFLFAWIEIRAINHDRSDSENRQTIFIGEQREHFSEIGDGNQSHSTKPTGLRCDNESIQSSNNYFCRVET